MPTAETLRCPSCGAAASSNDTKCAFCNAKLATVACPSCFGMMFVGAKFCSHCGAVAQRSEQATGAQLFCPKCERSGLKAVEVGKSHFLECERCQGMWLDVTTLQQICAEREQQSAVLGMPVDKADPAALETKFRYVPCPACAQLMNRLNFARMSGVIVDVCKQHGTWFDRDELRRVVEFIRAGGLDKARARQNEELEAERERILNAPNAAIPPGLQGAVDAEWKRGSATSSALPELARFLLSLFR